MIDSFLFPPVQEKAGCAKSNLFLRGLSVVKASPGELLNAPSHFFLPSGARYFKQTTQKEKEREKELKTVCAQVTYISYLSNGMEIRTRNLVYASTGTGQKRLAIEERSFKTSANGFLIFSFLSFPRRLFVLTVTGRRTNIKRICKKQTKKNSRCFLQLKSPNMGIFFFCFLDERKLHYPLTKRQLRSFPMLSTITAPTRQHRRRNELVLQWRKAHSY